MFSTLVSGWIDLHLPAFFAFVLSSANFHAVCLLLYLRDLIL